MKWTTFFLAFVGVIFVSSLGMAGPGPMGPGPEEDLPGPHMGMKKGMMKILLKQKVGLSDKQIRSIEDLKYKADKERIDIDYKIKKGRLELERLMDEDKPDKARILKQVDKLGQLNTQLKKNRVGLMLDIRTLLTPQQWEKMERLHREHRKMRRRKRMKRRGPMGPMGMDPGEPSGP